MARQRRRSFRSAQRHTCIAAYFLFAPVDYILARNRASDAPNPALYAALLSTVHMLLFAMMVRLYSARTRRDSLFLAMIAFACMLAAAVLTVDTAYLAFFLVFLTLGISTFVALEMERGAEQRVRDADYSGQPASAKTRSRARSSIRNCRACRAAARRTFIFYVAAIYGRLSRLVFHAAAVDDRLFGKC